MRSLIFAKRNVKEIVRDPISYIFLLAFPLVMLFAMNAINSGLPEHAQVNTFKIENLSVGICVFAFSFDMLFAALQISSDRNTAFLTRLYSSPMTTADFLLGYTLPLVVTAIVQCITVFAISALPFFSSGYNFTFAGIALTVLMLIPSALFFISVGMLFGSLFNNKAAPPLSSIIISLSGMIGGIWMDVEHLGDTISGICKALPFYRCVESGRATLTGRYSDILPSLIIILIYTAVIFTASVIAFKKKSKI